MSRARLANRWGVSSRGESPTLAKGLLPFVLAALALLLFAGTVHAQECSTELECYEVCAEGGDCLLGTCYCYSEPPPPPPPPPVVGSFRALTLNTALLDAPAPFGIGDKPCLDGRSTQLGKMLANQRDYDVVMLQEVFQDAAAFNLVYEIKNKYPYRVVQKPSGGFDPTPWDPEFKINGGLAILSKFPFLPVSSQTYYAEPWEECDGIFKDCGANKGWLHVRIDFHGVPINIISLHTQANYGGGGYTSTQQQQMNQLRSYIQSFPRAGFAADLSREIVILGGDYNIRGDCSTCIVGNDYFSVGGILGMREALREDHCSKASNSKYLWVNGGHTQDNEGFRYRLDMIFYDDSRSNLELRPSSVRVDHFYIGNTTVLCSAGLYYYAYDDDYISDHFGVEATFTVYSASAAPSEGSCGVVPLNPPWPTACFSPPNPEPSPPPVQVSFDAACSSDSDGIITNYTWREDNGSTHSGRVFSKTYWSVGDHDVELTVRDNDGYTATRTVFITVCDCCGQASCTCCEA